MIFRLYFVDKEDKNYYKEARCEYAKRLSRYCKLELVCGKNKRELWKKVDTGVPVICIDAGKNLSSSEALAQEIKDGEVQGVSRVSVVIGTPPPELEISESQAIIYRSISAMEFSEGLLATMAMEQIYRAYRIMHGAPYHK